MAFSTKQRILDASVRLFNEYGVDSVRLQQIAEEIGISVGNLAYHFKTKDAIIESVFEQVLDEFNHIFRQYLQAPDLAAFDQQLSLYSQFFSSYQFYLAEFFKNDPGQTGQQLVWQQAVRKMQIQLRSWLDFQVQREVFQPEPASGRYEQLAEAIWMTLIFLPVSCTMRGRQFTEAAYKEAVWKHLTPYFTDQGISEYTNMVLPLIDQ